MNARRKLCEALTVQKKKKNEYFNILVTATGCEAGSTVTQPNPRRKDDQNTKKRQSG